MVKFNDLLASAEREVNELEKRRGNLEQSIKSLEGREAFLHNDIKKLETQRDSVLATIDGQVEKNKLSQQEANKQLAATKAETSQLTTEHERLKSSYQAEINDLQAVLDGLNSDVDARRSELAELLKAKTDWQDELEILRADIISARDELAAIDEKINQARAAADEQIASFAAEVTLAEQKVAATTKQLTDTNEELEAVQAKVQQAKTELATTTKQHNDFIEYEKRARKALQDAEESLLRKEEQLDVQIVTSRRRRILDNVE